MDMVEQGSKGITALRCAPAPVTFNVEPVEKPSFPLEMQHLLRYKHSNTPYPG
jgi:hypothetical protein